MPLSAPACYACATRYALLLPLPFADSAAIAVIFVRCYARYAAPLLLFAVADLLLRVALAFRERESGGAADSSAKCR